MRRDDPRRRLSRRTTLEPLEDRVVMSADPVGGLLGGAPGDLPLEQHGAPAIEHHLLGDVAGEAPDFWLDPTVGDLEHHLSEIEQTLASANNLTGLTQARSDYGFLGTGQTVAVVDSGIAWDHYALGGGLGADFRVVGGWDFTEGDANPYDDGPNGSHGTHVSGIIGGNAGISSDSGVAPGVDLVGLRVFDDSGAGYFSWVESALQWVHQNRNALDNPITAVNLSLGTTWNSESIPSWAMLEDEFAQLENDGIFIAVSAGNSFTSYNTTGLSYPAASSHVVPVMSADDSGLLSYFSQRHERAIAAPGRYITSTVPDYAGNHNGLADDWASFSGTSMAAPYVAGASVLVREAMDFVGYTNITQQTIYDHMIATADRFYDSATSLSYNRLNVGAAIDALIPDDDFGSSVIDAYNLGTLSGDNPLAISGLIGKLDDVDFFSFTAGVTGTVSFTANTTHALAAAWDAVGGSGSVDGDTYTMEVVAGQTYSLGLSTTDGLGYYDLTIDAESVFTYTDWGTVAQTRLESLSNQGESWYRLQAGQTGYLTAEALFSDAAGNVDLYLYDGNLQPLVSAAVAGGNDRVDVLAGAGDEFYLCVVGTNADIDFQLTNLVSADGSTVNITGTDAADTFSFAAGATQHTIGINGVTYQLDASAVTAVNFAGGAGSDSMTMTGTAGDETATLRVGSATLVGAGFSASATGVEDIRVYGGGGSDTVYLYDSAGDDLYYTYADQVVMSGDGYSNTAAGFGRAVGFATQGNDTAHMYDSGGDDLYRTYDNRVVMSGNGFYNSAIGFDSTFGHASAGNDTARMYDSAGDDLYYTYDHRAVMSGDGFYNDATGFDDTIGYASTGYDTAHMHDSAGDDLYRTYATYVVMSGDGFCNTAAGFDRAVGYASGGYDRARMYDSAGDDLYRAYYNRVVMSGDGFYNSAVEFDSTIGYASAGYDRARMYDSAGDDLYRTYHNRVVMSGDGFYNSAVEFDSTIGYASSGNDRARMYDSAGDDLYWAYADRAVMSGNGFYNDARGFSNATGYASSGYDRVRLYDSAGNDSVVARAWGAYLEGPAFRNEAFFFDDMSALATAGGHDTADVETADYVFELIGQWS